MSALYRWGEELPDYARQNREVFARYGLAMYYSQCLEQQIALMLSSMYNEAFLQVAPEELDAFFDKNIKKTLGTMANDLKRVTCLPADLEDKLREAVKLRNYLAHRYFAERDRDILVEDGREKMIGELQDWADTLRNLDNEFGDLLRSWLQHNGVSEEEIREEICMYLASAEGE